MKINKKRIGLLSVFALMLAFSGNDVLAEESGACVHPKMSLIEVGEASCIDSGYELYECPYCGYQEYNYDTGFTGEHSREFSYWEVQPNCVTEGRAAWVCVLCGDTEIRSTPIASSEHTMGPWTIIEEATCVKEGSRESSCVDCGYTVTEKIPYAKHSYENWTTVSAATCSKEGVKKATCKVCGKTTEEYSSKKSHEFGSWEESIAPTDHSRGSQKHTCKVCGYAETQEILPEGTIEPGTRKKEIEVYVLQELLTEEQLLRDKVDGIYGSNTEKAIKEFQKMKGFEESGIAYPQTIVALLEDLLERTADQTKVTLGSGIDLTITVEGKITNLSFEREGKTCRWGLEALREESEAVKESAGSEETEAMKKVTRAEETKETEASVEEETGSEKRNVKMVTSIIG